ncbi:hypothetical protein N657DRAFT_283668 [Parathielavia appendiculata]|uniref:Uncharacterized protein n=1 Tax=Parathielavia appendiculata TaxID=2587402 RepID=A0AAN6Z510_9PEZI|nr:hypothetical protein N657DRAFT_283668 [Parathielavia appendiculata]
MKLSTNGPFLVFEAFVMMSPSLGETHELKGSRCSEQEALLPWQHPYQCCIQVNLNEKHFSSAHIREGIKEPHWRSL